MSRQVTIRKFSPEVYRSGLGGMHAGLDYAIGSAAYGGLGKRNPRRSRRNPYGDDGTKDKEYLLHVESATYSGPGADALYRLRIWPDKSFTVNWIGGRTGSLPKIFRFESTEAALIAAIQIEVEQKDLRDRAFAGGWYERMGRLSTDTRSALDERRDTAEFYVHVATLVGHHETYGFPVQRHADSLVQKGSGVTVKLVPPDPWRLKMYGVAEGLFRVPGTSSKKNPYFGFPGPQAYPVLVKFDEGGETLSYVLQIWADRSFRIFRTAPVDHLPPSQQLFREATFTSPESADATVASMDRSFEDAKRKSWKGGWDDRRDEADKIRTEADLISIITGAVQRHKVSARYEEAQSRTFKGLMITATILFNSIDPLGRPGQDFPQNPTTTVIRPNPRPQDLQKELYVIYGDDEMPNTQAAYRIQIFGDGSVDLARQLVEPEEMTNAYPNSMRFSSWFEVSEQSSQYADGARTAGLRLASGRLGESEVQRWEDCKKKRHITSRLYAVVADLVSRWKPEAGQFAISSRRRGGDRTPEIARVETAYLLLARRAGGKR